MHGLAGLEEAAGRGNKLSIPTRKVTRVMTEVTQPRKGRKRWSVRSVGRHAGASPSTAQRTWPKNDLKPHVTRTFKRKRCDRGRADRLWMELPLQSTWDERNGVVPHEERRR